jgi:hypothetical protein
MSHSSFEEIRNHQPGQTIDPQLLDEWARLLDVQRIDDIDALAAQLRKVMSEKNRKATRVLGSAYKAQDEGRDDFARSIIAKALQEEDAPFFSEIYRVELDRISGS